AVLTVVLSLMGWTFWSSLGSNRDQSFGNDQAPVSAVVLIDTSPRMLYQVAREVEQGVWESKTRLQESQEIADWLVRELPEASEVAVADATASELFFSVDIAAAAKRVSTLQISYQPETLVERIESSVLFLDAQTPSGRKPREIYVFTDRSLGSWNSKRQKELRMILSERSDLSLYLVDVSVENPTNYQMDDLELSAETIAVGGSVQVKARVLRLGPAGERPVHLYLDQVEPGKPVYLDGETVLPQQRLIRVAALAFDENKTQQVGFTINKLGAGIHHGMIRVEGDDSLSVDNQRYFTIEVNEPQTALLVRPSSGDGDKTPVVSGHVEVVLAPSEMVDSGQNRFEVTTVDQANLLGKNLSQYSSIYLLDPEGLNPVEWKQLNKYVAAGGGLALFLGENAKFNLGPDPRFRSPEASKILGGKLGEVWTPTEAFISISDYSHPVVQGFRRYATDDVWRDFPVYQHWGLELLEEDSSSQILARFSNGQPAIVARTLGEGTVVVVTTPLTEPGQIVGRNRWNDLTTGEWWPSAMLIDKLADFLTASHSLRLNYSVGGNVVLKEPAVNGWDRYLMFSPREEAPTEVANENDEIRYRFTDSVGHYRMKPIGRVGHRKGFSVNIGRGQTDLQQVSDSVLDSVIGENRYEIAKSKADIVRQQSHVREGKKFFPLLISMFGIILLMEFVMSNRFYRTL
ncbi:MAG: hypothetical protein VX438_15785, partial [Planctomycetota bacterium]|nr:hypothetical protein [Planctomycetota bacterium]